MQLNETWKPWIELVRKEFIFKHENLDLIKYYNSIEFCEYLIKKYNMHYLHYLIIMIVLSFIFTPEDKIFIEDQLKFYNEYFKIFKLIEKNANPTN